MSEHPPKTPIHTTAPTESTLTPSVMLPLRGGCSSSPASGNSGRRDELDGDAAPVVPDSCADMSSKSLFITASLTPLDGKPISCAMTRRSSTFSALSCVQSPFVPPLCTTQRNRVTDSCTSIFAQTRLANSSFKRLPSTDIPSSEAKAFNALIPSLRTWRRKGSTPPSFKPCCNSRSFSDISGWSEPRVTTYRGQARYESRTKSCADQLHALTNKRNTSLQLKLAKSCGFTKS